MTPTTREFFSRLGKVWPNRDERQAMADVATSDSRRVQRGARVLAHIPVFDAVLRNGISATLVNGGIRTNVIPTEAVATLNVRTLPGQSIDSVVARIGRVIGDSLVSVAIASRGTDAPASDFESPMFAAIRESAQSLDPSLTVVPYLSTGATDSARLRAWGMQAFGLLPFPMNQDDEDRMHGNDERLPLTSLEFGTKMIYGAVLRVAQ
jgi:acetylornithine deacetylase/succinyl-diaminopimelate desuccinylase-like protein